ncbi:MAG: mechanosensitive ion channel family protein [Methanimicrococcus sp.]|nr:mechanosensitive ion channel family protein [Methanimicrococcus sp.]
MAFWENLLNLVNYTDSSFLIGIFFILSGIVLFFWIRSMRKKLIQKAAKTDTKWDDILIRAVGKPLMVAALAIPAYYGVMRYILTPEGTSTLSETNLDEVLYVVLLAWFLSALVQNIMEFYGRKHIHGNRNDMRIRFLGLLDLLAVYIIWLFAFLAILYIYQIDLTPVIAGLGIAGIAVALAAQDMLGNLFGSAMIYADRPFKVGDRIKIDQYVGDILDIGLRSTKIKTLDNELMAIPNSIVSKSVITNYALPDIKIKVRLPFYVSPNSDIVKVKKILFEVGTQAANNFDFILNEPVPEVFLLEIEEYRLKLMVTFWSNRFDRKWESRDYINCEVLRRFREENIEFPVPQRKIYLRNKILPGVAIGSGTYGSFSDSDSDPDYDYDEHDGMNE